MLGLLVTLVYPVIQVLQVHPVIRVLLAIMVQPDPLAAQAQQEPQVLLANPAPKDLQDLRETQERSGKTDRQVIQAVLEHQDLPEQSVRRVPRVHLDLKETREQLEHLVLQALLDPKAYKEFRVL